MSLWTYLLNNLNYYIVALVTLFLWDLVDMYIEFKNFHFLRRPSFLTYYVVIGFFSIAAMEAGFLFGLFTETSKYLVAFISPLIFAIILQNLVVKLGGGEKTVNFADFFDRFRFAIKESLIHQDEINKVRLQTKLLNTRSIENEDLLDWCRFYSTEEELDCLVKKLAAMTPKGQRIEVIKHLARKAKESDIAEVLLRINKGAKSSAPSNSEKE